MCRPHALNRIAIGRRDATWVAAALLVGAAANIIGCRVPARPVVPVPPPATQPQSPANAAAASQPATSGAVIAGIVDYSKPPPKLVALNTAADAACNVRVFPESLVVNPDRTLRNAFVYIKKGIDPSNHAPPTKPLFFDVRGWVFVPHVLGVQTGQPVSCRNCSVSIHNFHFRATKNLPANFSQPKPGMITPLPPFRVREIGIPVVDDVHPWMSGYVCVVDHPFFNVTGPAGVFRFDGVPPGTYELECWHETLGSITQTVIVKAGEVAWIRFTY